MSAAIAPQWQEKASTFFSSSGVKLKVVGQSAGSLVGEAAKDARSNVAGVAGRVGSAVRGRWLFFQKPITKHAVQESFISVASSTGTLLRKRIEETKDRVAVGKMKVEEVAKKTAQKSKTILTDIERWQKGVASTDVFGVPIEMTVQRQRSGRAVPHVLINSADYLISSGLNTEDLFRADGDVMKIHELVSLFNHDWKAAIPENTSAIDIANLIKCYLASLPSPLVTLGLCDELRNARSSTALVRDVLKRLPSVNYMTLEYVTALLLCVSRKSLLNKMDVRSLAIEVAPVLLWRNGQRPEQYAHLWSRLPKPLSTTDVSMTASSSLSDWDMLADEGEETGASMMVPLDDGAGMDYDGIEVIQRLIECHNAVFTDANETLWN